MKDLEVSDYRPSLKRLFNDAASDTAVYIYTNVLSKHSGAAVKGQSSNLEDLSWS